MAELEKYNIFFFHKKRLLPRNEIIRISKKVGLFQKRSRYYFSKKSRQNEFKSHFRFRHQQQWLLCLETLVVFSSLSPLLCTNVKKYIERIKEKTFNIYHWLSMQPICQSARWLHCQPHKWICLRLPLPFLKYKAFHSSKVDNSCRLVSFH